MSLAQRIQSRIATEGRHMVPDIALLEHVIEIADSLVMEGTSKLSEELPEGTGQVPLEHVPVEQLLAELERRQALPEGKPEGKTQLGALAKAPAADPATMTAPPKAKKTAKGKAKAKPVESKS